MTRFRAMLILLVWGLVLQDKVEKGSLALSLASEFHGERSAMQRRRAWSRAGWQCSPLDGSSLWLVQLGNSLQTFRYWGDKQVDFQGHVSTSVVLCEDSAQQVSCLILSSSPCYTVPGKQPSNTSPFVPVSWSLTPDWRTGWIILGMLALGTSLVPQSEVHSHFRNLICNMNFFISTMKMF